MVSFRLPFVLCGIFLSSFLHCRISSRLGNVQTSLTFRSLLTKIHSHKLKNQSDIIFRTILKRILNEEWFQTKWKYKQE